MELTPRAQALLRLQSDLRALLWDWGIGLTALQQDQMDELLANTLSDLWKAAKEG